jgi:hypothetical protein
MVMVTGTIWGAAVTAIIMVGTGAVDIITDCTGADIADIHDMRQGRLEDEAALPLVSSLAVRWPRVRSLSQVPLPSNRRCSKAPNLGLAGLSHFAKSMPCNSAALRRMSACFIASFRSGPGGIERARSGAASASA